MANTTSGAASRTVWVNGRLAPGDEAALCVTDRSFQLGDGVFETLRVSGGEILELGLHLARLRASAAMLAIELPSDLDQLLAGAIRAVCTAEGLCGRDDRAAVRVTASRGNLDGRALLPPAGMRANLVVQAWRIDPLPAGLLASGLRVVFSGVRRDPASPLALVKTTSRAEFVFARLEAERRGADEALFLTTDGHLAESTTASIFLIDRAGLVTPSLDCGILLSTTREWVLSAGAPQLGLDVREARLVPDDLFSADEAFLASSVAGIVPIGEVEGRPIGAGVPGTGTLALRALRESLASGAYR